MAAELDEITVDAGGHLVQFYEDDAELARTVGGYLIRALRDGGAAVVIATEAHRRQFAAELEAAGIDPVACSADGTLVLLDAAATLGLFVEHGRVEHQAFRRVIGAVLHDAAAGGRAISAYGEMVALLWEAGDVLTAIELEKAWNDLAHEVAFGLVCAYRSESVQGHEHADALHEVCHLHTDVVGRPGAERRDVARAEFPAEPQAIALARRFVVDLLRQCDHSDALVADAQLVVSELATNAVVHARSPFTVEVRPHEAGLRLSVRDGSRAGPTVRRPDGVQASGRGIWLIDILASRWGVERADDGKTAWAELGA